MDEQRSNIKEFFRLAMITFSVTILAMSLYGLIFGDVAQESSMAFELGSDGLSYQTIFKVLLLAITNSGISIFIAITNLFAKFMHLWKMIFTMFSCLTVTGIMIAAFRWIQYDSLLSWLWFIAIFVVSFVLASVAITIKIRWEEKKYNDLLSNYKKEYGKND